VSDISFAVPDWWEMLQAGRTPIPELPRDEVRARRAVALYNSLRLPDVPGKPRLAEAGGDWFRDIIGSTFGAQDPDTGMPLVREVFCMVPKKMSKTTNAGALGLTALMVNERPNAQMSILGPTQKIALRCFDQAAGMIAADERLQSLFHVQDHLKTIKRLKTGAKLKITTFSMDVATGEIPALTILDELHLIAQDRDAARVIAQLEGGMITNAEAKLISITTQSDVEPMGVFAEKLTRARRIRDGEIDAGGMLPILYEFPEAMQIDRDKPWMNPKTWPAVLPNLGLSVQLPLLEQLFKQARDGGRDKLRIFASQHLNVQVGVGTQDGRWTAADDWDRNALPDLAGLTGLELLEAILDMAEVAVVGGDVGGRDDLFAITVAARMADDPRVVVVWSHAWCLETVLDLRKDIAVRLTDMEKIGDVTITETAAEQVTGFVDVCDMVRERDLLPPRLAIGLDPYGAAALVGELQARGYSIANEGALGQVFGVSQGYKLNGAIKGIERRLVDGTLRHGNQPLLAWTMSNAKATLRGNNTIITKEQAGSGKIDPVVAMFNAMILMDMNPSAPGGTLISVPDDYEVA
jgi:phage terminase large subunit-like protein